MCPTVFVVQQVFASLNTFPCPHRVTEASALSTTNPLSQTFSFTNSMPPGLRAAAERLRKAIRSSAG